MGQQKQTAFPDGCARSVRQKKPGVSRCEEPDVREGQGYRVHGNERKERYPFLQALKFAGHVDREKYRNCFSAGGQVPLHCVSACGSVPATSEGTATGIAEKGEDR